MTAGRKNNNLIEKRQEIADEIDKTTDKIKKVLPWKRSSAQSYGGVIDASELDKSKEVLERIFDFPKKILEEIQECFEHMKELQNKATDEIKKNSEHFVNIFEKLLDKIKKTE